MVTRAVAQEKKDTARFMLGSPCRKASDGFIGGSTNSKHETQLKNVSMNKILKAATTAVEPNLNSKDFKVAAVSGDSQKMVTSNIINF
jgi:hypothetical protein